MLLSEVAVIDGLAGEATSANRTDINWWMVGAEPPRQHARELLLTLRRVARRYCLLEPIGCVPPAEHEARYYEQAAVA